jgi:hypothetical protein
VCVAGIFVCEIRTINEGDVRARARATFRSHDLTADRLAGTDFIFDHGYGRFLDDVLRRTPPDTAIRLCVPAANELYDYTAVYLLAPRRVERTIDGDFLAAYQCTISLPPALSFRSGVLIRP